MRIILSDKPINPAETYALLGKDVSGSVVFHYAVVKEKAGGRITTCIDYCGNQSTEEELRTIAVDMTNRWNVEDVMLVRRVGRLKVGDIISLVAASSPNSEDAFESCKYGIGRLKKMVHMVKNEVFQE